LFVTAALVSPAAVDDGGLMGDPEKPRADRPLRRSFTASEKLAILEAYESLEGPGAKGAFLRREGLFSSQITTWRRARDAGAISGLATAARAPKKSREEAEFEAMKARAERAEAKLARTEEALSVMGKLHALLEDVSKRAENGK
jgi:transposase